MHLTFEQKDLTQATTIVAGLLKRSATTLPLLSNLLLEVRDGKAVFTGTDLESMVRVTIPVRADGPARLTLPADKLAELVALLPAGCEVTIEDNAGLAVIKTESNNYQLVTLPADDYPQWRIEAPVTRIEAKQSQFKRLIDAVAYAIPPKDHRRVLMGGLLEVRGLVARLTGTDGKKLSRMSIELAAAEGEENASLVVPGKLIGDLRKVLGEEGPLCAELGERQVAFIVDNAEFRTNCIEGRYPDCDAVIPKEFPGKARLNGDSFQMAVRRAGVTSDDKNKSIVLKFHEGGCDFESSAADVGRFTGATALEYQGPPVEIAFNYQLLIETLGSFSHPDILLNVKSEQAPCLFKCNEEKDHLCVLMPIKLADVRSAAM